MRDQCCQMKWVSNAYRVVVLSELAQQTRVCTEESYRKMQMSWSSCELNRVVVSSRNECDLLHQVSSILLSKPKLRFSINSGSLHVAEVCLGLKLAQGQRKQGIQSIKCLRSHLYVPRRIRRPRLGRSRSLCGRQSTPRPGRRRPCGRNADACGFRSCPCQSP